MPARRTAHLRWGRVSRPGATYFVTACVQNRQPLLLEPAVATHAVDTLRAIQKRKDAEIQAATIMPDHVHVLFTLGTQLQLGQLLGKFKTLVRHNGRVSWRWQEDGFEHQLRTRESTEDYGFYIFMNPYRARLLALGETWPWWFCPDPQRFRFLSLLSDLQSVPPEWVGRSIEIRSRLDTR